MSDNLFANVEGRQEVKSRSSQYQEVLDKRQRPVLTEDLTELESGVNSITGKVKKPKPAKELVIYPVEEIRKLATEYFRGDELAANVWLNKYALKDSQGNLYERTPDEMHWRIAHEVARVEKKYPNPVSAEEIYLLLKDFKYIVPQGGPMTGIGNNFQISSLSNCFVIGNKGSSDSYGGILKIHQEQVQ